MVAAAYQSKPTTPPERTCHTYLLGEEKLDLTFTETCTPVTVNNCHPFVSLPGLHNYPSESLMGYTTTLLCPSWVTQPPFYVPHGLYNHPSGSLMGYTTHPGTMYTINRALVYITSQVRGILMCDHLPLITIAVLEVSA